MANPDNAADNNDLKSQNEKTDAEKSLGKKVEADNKAENPDPVEGKVHPGSKSRDSRTPDERRADDKSTKLNKDTASAEATGNHKLEPFEDGRRQMDPEHLRYNDTSGMTETQAAATLNNHRISMKEAHQPEVQTVKHTTDGQELVVPPNTPNV